GFTNAPRLLKLRFNPNSNTSLYKQTHHNRPASKRFFPKPLVHQSDKVWRQYRKRDDGRRDLQQLQRRAPPAIAGKKWTSLFSDTGCRRPRRENWSSTATAIPGRRPLASQRRFFVPGYTLSRASMICRTVEPCTVTVSLPPVRSRRRAGIQTIAMRRCRSV